MVIYGLFSGWDAGQDAAVLYGKDQGLSQAELFKGSPSLHQRPFTGYCTKAETGERPEWIGLASVPEHSEGPGVKAHTIKGKRMTDPCYSEWITEAFPTCMFEALKTDSGWLGITMDGIRESESGW